MITIILITAIFLIVNAIPFVESGLGGGLGNTLSNWRRRSGLHFCETGAVFQVASKISNGVSLG
jgi:hypothetical protein